MLHWITATRTPYNEDLFRAVAGEVGELEVHYFATHTAPMTWDFEENSGYSIRFGGPLFRVMGSVIGYRFRGVPVHVVCGGWGRLDLVLLQFFLWIMRVPFAIWTDSPRVEGTSESNLRSATRGPILKAAFLFATEIWGTGKMATKRLVEIGAPLEKIRNFPYFIDLNRYQRPAETKESKTIELCCLGRLHLGDKNWGVAVSAFSIALNECRKSETKLNLRIAGTGPDEEALKSLITEAQIPSGSVQFCGMLNNGEVIDLLGSSNILLHPSYFEPYGVVILEAMALGCVPLASTGCGAAVDRIIDGENGYIHNPGDVEAMAEQIQTLAGDSEKLSALSDAAIESGREWPISRGVEQVVEFCNPTETENRSK